MRKIIIFLCLIAFVTSGFSSVDSEVHPENNSTYHNNMALRYLEEGAYACAIQEYKIAIALNPKSQAAANTYTNLGNVYMKIGYPIDARDCFEQALKINPLNFTYYQNLAMCFKVQNCLEERLKYYSARTNKSVNMIMVGLILIEMGQVRRGITKLDEFVMSEPDLIVSQGVKTYLNSLTAKLNEGYVLP